MTRILHIVPKLSEGGVARVVLNYYEKIDKNSIIFDFITHENDEGKLESLVSQGSKIFYCKTIGQIGIIRYYMNLKYILTNNKYDVIHIHVGHLTGVYAYMCRKNGSDNIICHAHTTMSPNSKHRIFMPILRKLAIRNATTLIACGKAAGEFCFGDAKFIVLSNGLDYDKVAEIERMEIDSLREQLCIITDEFILGNVAAFIYLKNHRFIIDVFERLLKLKPNSKLILIGDGPLRNNVAEYVKELRIQDKVLFLGERGDVFKLLQVLDVFLLPSLFEGLPVSGIEAQAAGVPCLFSDSIDRTVDCGLGLSKFLNIEDIDVWVEELYKIEKHEIDQVVVREALRNTGYDINSTVKTLIDIYISKRRI